MLERHSRTIRNEIRDDGTVRVTSRVEVREDGNLIAWHPGHNRLLNSETPASAWAAEEAPHAQGAVVTHNAARWIAAVETSEEPGTGTAWVELPARTSEQRFVDGIQRAVAHHSAEKVRAGTLTSEEATEITASYPAWRAAEDVEVGDQRMHLGTIYDCLQAHRTLPSWEPPNTPALWASVTPTGQVEAWAQPAGAHDAYMTGDRVLWEGSTYESTEDGNVWSPTDYPQGWTLVE